MEKFNVTFDISVATDRVILILRTCAIIKCMCSKLQAYLICVGLNFNYPSAADALLVFHT